VKRVILLLFTDEEAFDLNTPLSHLTWPKIQFFNRKEINLLGASRSFELSALMFKLTHTEFKEVPEGCPIPHYYMNDARRRYPFLFADTNPILYRKFNV